VLLVLIALMSFIRMKSGSPSSRGIRLLLQFLHLHLQRQISYIYILQLAAALFDLEFDLDE
jgi:hypothetical protein